MEGIFICDGLPGRQGGLVTCKKSPRKKKQGQGTGVTLFIWCWPGTAEGLPQAPRPRGAASGGGPGASGARSRSPCPAPARTLSAAACLNKENCTTKVRPSVSCVSPPPPAPLRWLSGGGGTSRPRALSPARPRLSPLPGALTPFHYCTARCDRDSSATGKEGQPGRWSQRWHSRCSGCRAGGTEGEPEWGGKILALCPSWPPPIGMMLGGSSGGGGGS